MVLRGLGCAPTRGSTLAGVMSCTACADASGGESAEGSGRAAPAAASAGNGGASSSEGRANISRTHSQDVGPTPSDWDPSYRSGAHLRPDHNLAMLVELPCEILWAFAQIVQALVWMMLKRSS